MMEETVEGRTRKGRTEKVREEWHLGSMGGDMGKEERGQGNRKVKGLLTVVRDDWR